MTEVTLKLLSDMIGTDKNNFLYNHLLTNRQAAGLQKAFANSSSKNTKLSKAQISKKYCQVDSLVDFLNY